MSNSFLSWSTPFSITGIIKESYFAPFGNYGTPQDLCTSSTSSISTTSASFWTGTIAPSTDEHVLNQFDGSHLFQHVDPLQVFHPDWNTAVLNYSRNEVRSFLISSVLFWLEQYHAYGSRVDAVASTLYLDYSRQEDEWIPNRHRGRETLRSSPSCGSSMKGFTDGTRMCRPLRKNSSRGQPCRVRHTQDG